ncbi:MAG: Homoserine kinase [Xylophilus sp.]|nr:MAG: Homoserine kinase [Xylophilus sp.]
MPGADAAIRHAASLWGLSGTGAPTTFSTNGVVRRFGNCWLKGRKDRRQCEREIAAMGFLRADSRVHVPRLVPNARGDSLACTGGTCWFVEESLCGVHPDADDGTAYQEAAAAVGRLHAALEHLAGEGIPCSTLAQIHAALEIGRPEPILRSTGELIAHRLRDIGGWETQVIHGDLSHPNLLVAPDGQYGFIDFEFLARDAREFDVAILVITALCRSHLSDDAKAAAVQGISEAAGLPAERLLLAAVAKRWLAAISNLAFPGGPSRAALSVQLAHLEILHSWLGRAGR